MTGKIRLVLQLAAVMLLYVGWSATAAAKPEPEACLELGALAYDDWTKTAAGGSGMPAGESERDYLRCKSCHGWDRLGMNGGYVRRTRTATRPNAGYGDTDTTSRDIAPGMGDYYHIRADEVLHTGTGRSYEDGSGSWVFLDGSSTADDKVAYAAGYTLGNQHPDFSTTGANAGDIVLTQDQVDCLVDFINYGDSDPKFYFYNIDTDANPVWYTIHPGASTTAGRTFYVDSCMACHGEPDEDFVGGNNGQPEGGILAYLRGDGKYSEFVHKARWGIPDTVMTADALGRPTSQNMIDVMLYLQEFTPSGFVITNGISGTWYDQSRSGEGFMIDVAAGGVVVVSFYTYDTTGRQFWVIGSGLVNGNTFEIDFETTDGGIYGEPFDPLLVNRYPWGKGTFTFDGCFYGLASIVPNQDYADEFVTLDVELVRGTTPVSCGND
ncbi:MAG: hypothetical protein KJN61_10645 [Gammaproteobacteria bacterium]|nr:hypothetical protein [Gammaproteobacteria bacterium]